MKPLHIAVGVVRCGVVAVALGADWQRTAVGVVFGLLVAAMLETMPLSDWLYPKDDRDEKRQP
jgi:hypothetical protein